MARRALGHISKKHAEFSANLEEEYRRQVKRATDFAMAEKCVSAMKTAVYASYLWGKHEAHAMSGHVSRHRGGPGLAEADLGYVMGICVQNRAHGRLEGRPARSRRRSRRRSR